MFALVNTSNFSSFSRFTSSGSVMYDTAIRVSSPLKPYCVLSNTASTGLSPWSASTVRRPELCEFRGFALFSVELSHQGLGFR